MQVWLIDDSQADLYLLQRAVRQACPDARITTFASIASAIACWRKSPPQCVFVDLNLGLESGLDFVDALDEAPEQAPAVNVVVSGLAPTRQISERLRRAKVLWQVCEKPVRAQHVTELLARAGFARG